MKNISYLEARILKTAGAELDLKVTVKIEADGMVAVFMRDFVFYSYKAAAQFIRLVGETELLPVAVRS